MNTELNIVEHVDDAELMQEVEAVEKRLVAVTVTNQEERNAAIQIGKQSKDMIQKITDWFAPAKKAAHDAHKAICAQEKSALDGLKQAQAAAKKAILAYDAEQERARRAEEARLQREAEERARRERERLEREAARLKTPEKKQERLEMAAEVSPDVVHVESRVERAQGESYRTAWSAEVVDESAVPREWLIVDTRALNAFARSTKGTRPVPGVRFVENKQLILK